MRQCPDLPCTWEAISEKGSGQRESTLAAAEGLSGKGGVDSRWPAAGEPEQQYVLGVTGRDLLYRERRVN